MTVRIDARGLRCPWPAIRAARALREGAAIVEILADDPAAGPELTKLAEAQGARISMVSEQSALKIHLVAASPVNGSFTRQG